METVAAINNNGAQIVNGTVQIKPKKTNRVARGVSTNELIFSADHATNDEVFPQVLKLFNWAMCIW
jgi:hypothetical protein